MADQTDSIITVTVPSGSYTLSSTARIFSNTTLNLKGVTLTCADNGKFNMIISGTPGSYKDQTNYNKSDLCTGYDGFKNITINGGTLIGNSENTICVSVFPNRCSWPMKESSSIVLGKQTFINIE